MTRCITEPTRMQGHEEMREFVSSRAVTAWGWIVYRHGLLGWKEQSFDEKIWSKRSSLLHRVANLPIPIYPSGDMPLNRIASA